MFRLLSFAFLISLVACVGPSAAQAPAVAQPGAAAGASGGRGRGPGAPTRDPNTPGYVTAKDLEDGTNAPPNVDGNFILGPTHNPAPEVTVQEGVPQGTVYNFSMESTDSKFYPGIKKGPDPNAPPAPATPPAANAGGAPRTIVSHPGLYTRKVAVYVPKQYVPGTVAPFIVGADGPDQTRGPDIVLFTALDNLIAAHKVPVMIAISIGNGGDDAQGSERGLEYDTMSGKYAEFVETEVLPLVEKQANVKLTKDPDARATMGEVRAARQRSRWPGIIRSSITECSPIPVPM